MILDNSTRWNSTYYSIERGLKLSTALRVFLQQHAQDLHDDQLSEDDWQQLQDVVDALWPFKYITERLEGNSLTGSHGAVWEAITSIDYLMEEIEEKRRDLQQQRQQGRHRAQQPSPLEIAYQNSWEKLAKYNSKTDENHEIYAAAALLNPCLRKTWFDQRWTGVSKPFIDLMLAKNRSIWESEYRQQGPQLPRYNPESRHDSFLARTQPRRAEHDQNEFDTYINGPQVPLTSWSDHNVFEWWMHSEFPSLRQWAFDVLSIPAMSAEVERVFSQARRLITVDRNRLGSEMVEQLACMKHWLDHNTVG